MIRCLNGQNTVPIGYSNLGYTRRTSVSTYSLVPKERHVRKESNGSTLGLYVVLKESHDSTLIKELTPKESHDCSFSLT